MEDFIVVAYTASVIVAVAMFAGALAILAAADAGRLQQWRRNWLARRLAGTRLHAVLIRLGIRPEQYVQEVDARVLARQIAQCGDCRAHHECDYAINSLGVRVPVPACPNRMTLPH